MSAFGRAAAAWRTKAVLGASDLEMMGGGIFADSGIRRRSREAILGLYEINHWMMLAGDVVSARYSAAQWLLLKPEGASAGNLLRSKLAGNTWWGGKAIETGEPAALAKAIASGDAEEILDHPFLTMLRAGTTGAPPWMSLPGYEVDKLERLTIDLVGEWMQILFRDPSLGIPISWWPIPPTWVRTPTSKRQTFEIRVRGAAPKEWPPEDVAWYKRPRPTDPYGRGVGVGETLDHEAQIDEHGATYLAALLKNHGRMDLLINLPGAGETQREQIENRWRETVQGPARGGLAMFLSLPGDKTATVQDFSKTPSDLSLDQSREMRAKVFLQVWRIPPDVVGMTQNSNRATAHQGEISLRRNKTIPDLEARCNWLQQRFFEPIGIRPPEYPGGWIVSYRLPPLEDIETRNEIIKSAPFAFTQNKILDAAGSLPVEGGDKRYYINNSISVVTEDELDGGQIPTPAEEP